ATAPGGTRPTAPGPRPSRAPSARWLGRTPPAPRSGAAGAGGRPAAWSRAGVGTRPAAYRAGAARGDGAAPSATAPPPRAGALPPGAGGARGSIGGMQGDTGGFPDWVQDAVFYQIFPDRFARSA